MGRARADNREPPGQAIAGPRTILRVLDVLRLVASRPKGWTLTEIVTALALPKTSAFSLLRTLENGGYLHNEDGRYALGREAFKLGASLYQATSFPRSTRPVLEELATLTGETVMLATLSDEGDEVCYVDVIESEAPLRFSVRTGNRRPLYAVAAGKILLAYQPRAVQDAYLARTTFIRFTPDTSLKADMARIIREAPARAVVLDANGIIDGAAAIASPCFDGDGLIACAVALAGPTARLLAQREQLEARALKAGEQISRILGYRGPYPPSPAA